MPKTLVPVAGELTILDIIPRNLASVGLTEVAAKPRDGLTAKDV